MATAVQLTVVISKFSLSKMLKLINQISKHLFTQLTVILCKYGIYQVDALLLQYPNAVVYGDAHVCL